MISLKRQEFCDYHDNIKPTAIANLPKYVFIWIPINVVFMSPVSPVFNTVELVKLSFNSKQT